LPIPAGTFRNLNAQKNAVFYLRNDKKGQSLFRYDLEKRKEELVLEEINGYTLSHNGEKILFSKNRTYGIIDAKAGQKAESLLNLQV
jgi:tricorn protease-like protein